jgi:hypothetical protein
MSSVLPRPVMWILLAGLLFGGPQGRLIDVRSAARTSPQTFAGTTVSRAGKTFLQDRTNPRLHRQSNCFADSFLLYFPQRKDDSAESPQLDVRSHSGAGNSVLQCARLLSLRVRSGSLPSLPSHDRTLPLLT